MQRVRQNLWTFVGVFLALGHLSYAKEVKHNSITDIDKSIIDHKTDPCDDFYQFACGKWIDKTKIPADLPMWGRSFMPLREKNREILKKILEDYSKGNVKQSKNPYAKKLGDFYTACMNTQAVNKNSVRELKEELAKIDALTADELKTQLPVLLAQLQLMGVNVFFNFASQQDLKNATQVIGLIDQGGLSLPDRDYYLKDDPATVKIRNQFVNYVQKIWTYMGASQKVAHANAQKILQMETFLAKNSMSRVDRRNPYNVYHRLDRKGLIEKAPQFNWAEFFKASGVPDIQAINVAVPEFMSGFNELLVAKTAPQSTINADDFKTYLKWHLMSTAIPALPDRFINANFKFVSEAFSGQKELEARWKRCVNVVNGQMGFALGRSYVEVNYSPEAKAITEEMIQNVEGSFRGELDHLSWMDDSTRKQALKKLKAVVNKVGYPQKWRSYDAFTVDRKSYLRTLLEGGTFNSKYELNKIGKPLNREEWEMTPSAVNAYYDPSMNEMVFPAGILQPPFFSKNAPMGFNYGGIGMVMGHELTHGFDDEGRHYDAEGNLADWWSQASAKAFTERAECVAKEYDAFEVLPGLHLNGKLTLGENIADHDGLKVAYQAWMKSKENPNEPQKTKEKQSVAEAAKPLNSKHKGAWTEDQKFFLAFAQSWCSKTREPLQRLLVKTDPHSPAKFRVNGTISQFSEFAKAFQCEAGTLMAPVNRCELW